MTTLVQCNDCEVHWERMKSRKINAGKKKLLPSTSSSILIIQIDLYDQFRKQLFKNNMKPICHHKTVVVNR